MESAINRLEKILINFKKSGSRGYQETTLISKLEEIDLLKTEFYDAINKTLKTEDTEIKTELFEKYYNRAKILFEQALLTPNDQQQNLVSMATFNLETAIKIIPEFKGNYKDLQSFLTIVELIEKTLDNANKAILISFVYNAKLSNLVRTVIGVSEPKTFQELKESLINRYRSKRTVSQIQTLLQITYRADIW